MKLSDPVDARFKTPVIALTAPEESREKTAVPLPARSPDVITTRRVPRVPRPAKHRTDVSDSHSVPSHPVAPDRTIDVYATSPRLPPCTVTDPDPVPGLLRVVFVLKIGKSYVM